jgi:crossover junction endodeoxyribonuclease RuvC
MIVLGIDPGTLVTGYGVIEKQGNRLRHLDNGGIFPSKGEPLPQRIFHIFHRIEALIAKFSPDVLALEDIFVAKNVSSTLKLGHARGAAMVAGVRAGLPVFEYSANQVKLALTGYGHAGKEQIQKMVQTLLGLTGEPFTDASDALAVAICHSHSIPCLEKMQRKAAVR